LPNDPPISNIAYPGPPVRPSAGLRAGAEGVPGGDASATG